MKAIFIAYNQAYNEEIADLLGSLGQRGYTRWEEIQGKGNVDGIPHMGNHAWPEMNNAILTAVEDSLAPKILEALKEKDKASPDLGIRAFMWNIETFC